MNLTAIKDRPSAISRHINDSLAVLPAMDRAVELSRAVAPVRIVDVGSGAGLPGLIFATLRPEWRVTLLDSLNKRCTFNTAAAEAMGLGNVDVLWRYGPFGFRRYSCLECVIWCHLVSFGFSEVSVCPSSPSICSTLHLSSRAEDAGANEAYREQFDVATARAVAEVRTLAELCLPLVRVGGYWVAPKGPGPEEEVHAGLRAIETLGGEARDVRIDTMELQGTGDEGKPAFTVVTVRKVSPTPAQYPRKANAMKKRPL